MSGTAKIVLGEKECTHQDWFDENNRAITNMLSKKKKTFTEWQNNPDSIPKKEIQVFPSPGSTGDPEDAIPMVDKKSQRGVAL